MNYYTLPPSQELAPYVQFFWIFEDSAISSSQPFIHRSMADGCCELLFHYQGRFSDLSSDGTSQPSFTAHISGPSQTFSRHLTQEAFGIFGAYLYPFAIPAFFGLPASVLANKQVDLATLLGQEGNDLEEKIMLASNNTERVFILTSFLIEKLRQGKQHSFSEYAAVLDFIENQGAVKVELMAQRHCLSTRQFERKFQFFAGFPPKLYARILRFQTATESYHDKHLSLTDIAHMTGYYDQSHFIHDFKCFSGYHPKTYFRQRNEGAAWKDAG